MPRRGENIRKRKDGRWEGRYYVPGPQQGRKALRSVYAGSYKELKEKLAVLRKNTDQMSAFSLEGDTEPAQGISFGNVAAEWLAMVESTKKHATYMKYRTVYEKHIQERLGRLPLGELNMDALAGVFQDNREGQKSESLQKSISCVLNQILSYAAVRYHTGPPRYAHQIQKKPVKPVQVFSRPEQSRLLQFLYDEMDIYKLGIIICLSTGLRLGEICSLKWGDIDLDEKILYVNTTVQRIAVEGRNTRTVLLEGEPKSIFSKRQIPLSEELAMLLTPYRRNAGEYVVTGRKPMEPRTYQNKFRKYLEMSGVERKNFHVCRHTFATNCISSGTDIKSLSEILGHSDVKITLNRYVHPTTETKRQHMNSLFSIYGQLVGHP